MTVTRRVYDPLPLPDGKPVGKPFTPRRLLLLLGSDYRRQAFGHMPRLHGWYCDGRFTFKVPEGDKLLKELASLGEPDEDSTRRAGQFFRLIQEMLEGGWSAAPAACLGYLPPESDDSGLGRTALVDPNSKAARVRLHADAVVTILKRHPEAMPHLALREPEEGPVVFLSGGNPVAVVMPFA
jgi:hypothetical protein